MKANSIQACGQAHHSDMVLAEALRVACAKAALLAYDDAGIRGLCHEGRWECALAALRDFDLQAVTEPVDEPQSEWTIRHIVGIC